MSECDCQSDMYGGGDCRCRCCLDAPDLKEEVSRLTAALSEAQREVAKFQAMSEADIAERRAAEAERDALKGEVERLNLEWEAIDAERHDLKGDLEDAQVEARILLSERDAAVKRAEEAENHAEWSKREAVEYANRLDDWRAKAGEQANLRRVAEDAIPRGIEAAKEFIRAEYERRLSLAERVVEAADNVNHMTLRTGGGAMLVTPRATMDALDAAVAEYRKVTRNG